MAQVTQNGSVKAKYTWLADGRKAAVRDGSGTNGYDYLGNLTLVRSGGTATPEAAFADGVIRNTEILFFEKDHLGSVRAVLTDRGDVLERSDYMPFGLRHGGGVLDVNNDYRFNGKEVQTLIAAGEHLDYGARLYRADQAPSWYTPDPLAEKYYSVSPYAFCGNNPISRIDFNGMDWYQTSFRSAKWLDMSDETYTDSDGFEWRNVGKSFSHEYADGEFVNYYQNAAISLSYGGAVDAEQSILDNRALYLKFIGEESPLSARSQSELFATGVNHRRSKDITVDPTRIYETVDRFMNNDAVAAGISSSGIVSNFSETPNGIKGTFWLGAAFTGYNAVQDFQLYQQGELTGMKRVDATMNIVSVMGTPGAAISLSYTAARGGANLLMQMEQASRAKAHQEVMKYFKW